jgi:hypothetical protein
MYLRKELHPQGYCSVFAFIHSPLRGLGFCVGLVPNAYHINTATYAYLAPRMAWHLSNCERANTVRQYLSGTSHHALPTLYYYYKPMLVLCQYLLGQFVSQSRFVLCVYIKMFRDWVDRIGQCGTWCSERDEILSDSILFDNV